MSSLFEPGRTHKAAQSVNDKIDQARYRNHSGIADMAAAHKTEHDRCADKILFLSLFKILVNEHEQERENRHYKASRKVSLSDQDMDTGRHAEPHYQ